MLVSWFECGSVGSGRRGRGEMVRLLVGGEMLFCFGVIFGEIV